MNGFIIDWICKMPLHERFEGLHGVEEISGFLDKQFSNVYMDRKYKERNQKLRRLLEDSNRRLYTFKMVQNSYVH